MKKIFLAFLVLFFLSGGSVWAEESPYAPKKFSPLRKLTNGVKDFVTSPINIPVQTSKIVNNNRNKVLGLFGGILEGTFRMVHQTVSGLVDIATFPIDPTCHDPQGSESVGLRAPTPIVAGPHNPRS